MVGLFDRFKKTERYSNYPDIAREPTARLPYALFGPTVVTHFPLFYKSHEDDNFELRAETLWKYVTDNADSHLTLDDHLRDKIVDEIRDRLGDLSDVDNPIPSDLRHAVSFVWYACRVGFACTVIKEPELFLFNANTRIRLEINRFAHRAVIKGIISQIPTFEIIFGDESSLPLRHKSDIQTPNLNIWRDNPKLSAQAFLVTNCAVFHFTNELIGASTLLAAEPPPKLPGFADRKPFLQQFQEDRPLKLRTAPDFRTQKRLGGLISWFDAVTGAEKDIIDTALTNRKLFHRGPLKWRDSKQKLDPLYDDYLSWRRGDRNWRYTFFDGCYEYPNDGAEKLNSFLSNLLQSRRLASSFPDTKLDPELEQAFDKYPFPGSRIAGALYYILPAELLVVVLARIDELSDRISKEAGKRSEIRVDVDHRSTSGRNFAECLEVLDDLEKSMCASKPPFPRPSELRSRPKPTHAFMRSVRDGGATDQEILAIARKIGLRVACLYDWITFGAKLKANMAAVLQERFYQCFADIAEIFWKYVYGSETHSLGQDDFVSSSVIDGRAIYFSNFRPFETNEAAGSLGFTRTLFVDFRLTPYQRGRLVRRLCDIATFRMSCVKDIDRIHALSDGISQINEDFNLVVSKSPNVKLSKNEEAISNALQDAVVLYQRALGFNMFITEGVSGRKGAAIADWVVVQKQVADIRESRLSGHAQLGNFLERGLGLSILEIGQIVDRYENLIHRIGSHMSMIRTQLVSVHTTNIAAIMNNFENLLRENEYQIKQQTNILIQSADLLKQAEKLSRTQIEFLGRQTELLSVADLLVWLGGTYYLWSLSRDAANVALDRVGSGIGYEHLSETLFAKICLPLFVLGIVFVLVYWFKQGLRNFAQRTKTLAQKLFFGQ